MPPNLPKIHRGKRHKPSETDFCQQKLNAWRPLITPRCVYPFFFIIGAACIALGACLHMGALHAMKVVIPYTNCTSLHNSSTVQEVLATSTGEDAGPVCHYDIVLHEPFNGDVTFYYGLTNYYQNNRMYIMSRDDVQLFGENLQSVQNCDENTRTTKSVDNSTTLYYAPCGAVANSMFTDKFFMSYEKNGTSIPVPFSTKNVLQPYERTSKYRNPHTDSETNLCQAFAKQNTTRPPSWKINTCQLGSNETGYGFENVDFIVWMNVAPLPDFQKKYRTLKTNGTGVDEVFKNGLPNGTYTLKIHYNYNVSSFNGEKSFIIATTSFSGPKNFFLGIAYMTVGLFLFLLGLGLIVYDCINKKMKNA
ncbi:hypothetical protein L596_005374 [Steinernema carpocapsae]|uniref:Cell cycle control protein 50A n=1 Tax=Steinernema carpocapsae TaxID=34508 RepID=A0A4V6I8M0_STECR|nr:hypothetical protein L596_005374 [Steinernema carpocapsae]